MKGCNYGKLFLSVFVMINCTTALWLDVSVHIFKRMYLCTYLKELHDSIHF